MLAAMRTLAMLGVLALPSAAYADAISNPPEHCTEGSQGITCHGAPTCRPIACAGDAECGAGRACRERELCIESHCCGGRTCFTSGGRNEAAFDDHVAASCAGGAACGSGECRSVRVCVPTDPDRAPMEETTTMDPPAMATEPAGQTSGEDGGGCATSSSTGGALVLAAIGAVVLGFRTRRRTTT
jgi:hypothetical protein